MQDESYRGCAPLAERLWRKVEKGTADECWEWQGKRSTKGYGLIARGSRDMRSDRAHRVAYEVARGPIPAGLFVLHHCDNPPCCNPSHLFLGTAADNTADMMRKGRGRLPGLKGQDHPRARLTDEDIADMRAAYQAGQLTQRELAEDYGVREQYVWRLVNRHARA